MSGVPATLPPPAVYRRDFVVLRGPGESLSLSAAHIGLPYRPPARALRFREKLAYLDPRAVPMISYSYYVYKPRAMPKNALQRVRST